MAFLRVAKFANEYNISSEDLDQRSPPKVNVKQEDIDYRPPSSSGRRKSDQESSPDKEMHRERKFLGPYDKVDNEVSFRCRTSNGNNDEEELMRKMGLPTYFTSESENNKSHYVEEGTIRERGRRGEKNTYYCEICLIELNSVDTMNSHVKGTRHMKKKLSIAQQMEEASKRGEPVPKAPKRVVQIPNPEPLKKKVPRRLHEKIQETMDPVVGLDFIDEYRSVSDIEMEAHYECKLCEKQGQANGMFMHLMGSEHRQKFVDNKFENDQKYMDLSQRDLLDMATKYRENNLRLSDVITTHNSDELYPWPPGKAPWSLENGGTGIAPDNARENYGKVKKEKNAEYEGKPLKQNYGNPAVKKERNLWKENEETRSSVFSMPETIKSLASSVKETEQYLELGSEMLKHVLDLDFMDSKERRIQRANLASIINIAAAQIERGKSLESDKNRRSKGENRSTSRSPQSFPETSASLRSSQSNSHFATLQRSRSPKSRRKRSRSHSRSSSPSSTRRYRRRT